MQLDGTLEALINSELAEALLITALTIPGLCLRSSSLCSLHKQERCESPGSGEGRVLCPSVCLLGPGAS